MDSEQLYKALSENIHTRDIFVGVFASDQLPMEIYKYPACFIANVDSSSKSGSHWLAFYISSPNHLEFFDSYGQSPSSFRGRIWNYVKKYSHVNFNPMTLQSNVSAVCGHYCLYYLYSKCRGRSLNEILLSFIPEHLLNDVKVYNFVTKRFKVHTPFYE